MKAKDALREIKALVESSLYDECLREAIEEVLDRYKRSQR